MSKEVKAPLVSIFCKLVDATLDCDGNIHLILSKDKKTSTEETLRKVVKLLNDDVTIIFTEFSRRR